MKSIYLIILGMLYFSQTTFASQELGYATGCPKLPIERWESSEAYPLSDTGNTSSQRTYKPMRALERTEDLEPQMKHMPVKHQMGLKACVLFGGVGCAEFVSNMRFSETELALRVAVIGTPLNNGYDIIDTLESIVKGLIPLESGIPFRPFHDWARLGVLKKEYYTSVEEAKRCCCPEVPSDRILPAWKMEEHHVFGKNVTIMIVPRPIGFWKEVNFNVFQLFPDNLDRLKEILQYVPVFIAMDTILEYDRASNRAKSEIWWESIRHKKEGDAKIDLYQNHATKMESGELVVKDGGHAVCLCGYDDEKEAFKFRNSWGTSYANNGYGYISYSVVRFKYPACWYIEGDKAPIYKKEASKHVYRAFVIVSNSENQYSPDEETEKIHWDEGNHRVKLNEMLLEFKANKTW